MNRFFHFLSTVAVLCSFVLSAGALEKFDVATASVTRQNPEIARGVRFSGKSG
ncbi:hypothetical protein SDC9_161680 [bioreactor metagenome]|uniref:Uncharacterized protein n=1 Tax=bioreactor metagenome TaxID=1076179 RepID=A0A645FQ99_9ZZZZ